MQEGSTSSKDKGLRLLNDAAAGGHVEATAQLGSIYAKSGDLELALKLFKRAAKLGHGPSLAQVGLHYRELDTPHDQKKGMELIQWAARTGDPTGLAAYIFVFVSSAWNCVCALSAFKEWASAACTFAFKLRAALWAQNNQLGNDGWIASYTTNMATMNNMQMAEASWHAWRSYCAPNNSARAAVQYSCAMAYYQEGNETKGFGLLLEAAEGGHADSVFELAQLCTQSYHLESAVKLYRHGVRQEHGPCMLHLGSHYIQGDDGVPQDKAKGERLIWAAVRTGDGYVLAIIGRVLVFDFKLGRHMSEILLCKPLAKLFAGCELGQSESADGVPSLVETTGHDLFLSRRDLGHRFLLNAVKAGSRDAQEMLLEMHEAVQAEQAADEAAETLLLEEEAEQEAGHVSKPRKHTKKRKKQVKGSQGCVSADNKENTVQPMIEKAEAKGKEARVLMEFPEMDINLPSDHRTIETKCVPNSFQSHPEHNAPVALLNLPNERADEHTYLNDDNPTYLTSPLPHLHEGTGSPEQDTLQCCSGPAPLLESSQVPSAAGGTIKCEAPLTLPVLTTTEYSQTALNKMTNNCDMLIGYGGFGEVLPCILLIWT